MEPLELRPAPWIVPTRVARRLLRCPQSAPPGPALQVAAGGEVAVAYREAAVFAEAAVAGGEVAAGGEVVAGGEVMAR